MPWISLLTGIIVTLVILFILVMHTDFFARSSGRMLSRYLFGGTDFMLRFEKMSGNPLKDITIEGLSVRYRGEEFSFDVLRVERVHVKYSLPSLLHRNIRVEDITVIDPHLWIKPDSSGTYILPGLDGTEGGAFPSLDVKRFSVQGGQVITQGPQTANALRNINVSGSIRVEEWEVRLEITEGTGEDIARDVSVNGLSGGVRLVRERGGVGGRSNRIFLDGFSVELEETNLTASGIVTPDSMTFHVKMHAEPIDIAEIMHLLDIESSHFGELQGNFIARGNPDTFTIRGIFNGIFSGYALNDFGIDVRFDPRRISVLSCDGRFNGALVMGNGWYTFADPEALHLDLDVAGMNLAMGFFPDTDVPDTDFNGSVIFDYSFSDDRISFFLALDEGHFNDFPFTEATITGTYSSGDLTLDRVLMVHPSHRVTSHGTITADDVIKMYFDIECARGDTLFPYLGIDEYRADLVMNGVWEGNFDTWEVRASGSCSNFVWERAVVHSGELKLAVIKDADYSVYVDLTGDSCTIDPVGFAGIDLSLEHVDGVTSFKRLNLTRRNVDIEMRGDITGHDDDIVMNLRDVFIDAFGERWTGGGRSTVAFRDSTIKFEDVQLHSRRGAIYLDCFLYPGDRRLDGAVSFERLDLELLNRGGLVSMPIAGDCRGRIACAGDLSDPEIEIVLNVENGTLDTTAVDSLTLWLKYSNGRYTLDSVVVSSLGGKVRAAGVMHAPRLADLYRERESALHRATVDIEAECRRLSLAPILPLAEWAPFSRGIYTGRIGMSDSLAHPEVGVRGVVEELDVGLLTVPSVEIDARIDPGGLVFEGAVDLGLSTSGDIYGRIPLVRKKWLYVPDNRSQMSLELALRGGDVRELADVTDHIAEGDGAFSAEFRVGGTTSRPDIFGEFTLSDARFRLAGMEEKFFDVTARILLKDTLITIEEIRGREGKEGSFRCSGAVTLKGWKPDQYDLAADLDDFLLASVPDVIAIMSGRLLVGTETMDQKNIPVVTGNLEVKQAEIYYDLGDFAESEKSTTMEAPAWILEVDLDVPGNTWLKTADANVEMQGKITAHHNQRGTYLRGELKLIRGWYNVYNNKFRVKTGTLEFVHAESFRPVVNIEAETRDPEGRKIYLNLVWLQDDVEPRLSLYHEDPGYSETDIWKMLGGGVVGSADGEGGGWDALGAAQNIAANYIERILNSQMEGVTIELESGGGSDLSGGVSDEKKTMVAIGKYLSEGLYVKFKQGLSISSARQIEVEYRISDLFVLRSEIIKYSEKVLQGKSPQSGDEINVDIKLRWEF